MRPAFSPAKALITSPALGAGLPAFLLTLLLAGCGGFFSKEELKIPPDPPESHWLLVSGGSAGLLESCNCLDIYRGGLPTRAEALRRMRERNPRLVLLDLGSNARVGDLVNTAKADFTFKAMSMMEYDAVLAGQDDLMFGLSGLVSAFREYETPFICANLRRTWGEYPDFWRTRLVVEKEGLRIGITGVAGMALTDLSLPYALDDPVAALRREVEALRGEVDVIVALSDSIVPQVNEELAALPGVDLLVAHPAGVFPPSERRSPTPILTCEWEGRSLGRLGFERADGALVFGSPQMYPISSEGPEVFEVRLLIDGIHEIQQADPRYAEMFPGFLLHLPAEQDQGNLYLGYESCIPCHADEYEQWKATPHAHAYQTLVKNRQQYNSNCVVCHVTGFGRVDGFHVKLPGDPLAGVQCESCHGPGGRHVEDPRKDNIRLSDRAICETCHNEGQSPRFKEHFEEYWRKAIHGPRGGAGASSSAPAPAVRPAEAG